MTFDIYDYHKNRTILYLKFIVAVFDKDERMHLKRLQNKYPNNIIRMPNADLIAAGFISGIGGSVPSHQTTKPRSDLANNGRGG